MAIERCEVTWGMALDRRVFVRVSRVAMGFCTGAAIIGGLPSAAVGAVMDCSRAANATETAICAQPSLQRLDGQLATVFGRLMRVVPARAAALRTSQLHWLTKRDQCNADSGCIEQRYDERIKELRKQLHGVLAYEPDEIDRAALDDLKQAVDAIRRSDTEFPLDKALDQFSLKDGVTSFHGGDSTDDNGDATALPHRRPHGVTEDEWRALKASGPFSDDAVIEVDYRLLPVEGESRRVLIVTALDNGSGVYSYSTAWVQRDGRFVSVLGARSGEGMNSREDDVSDALLLSFEGKGANQSSQWVRLRGRVYAAYIDSEFGADNVYLVRPLTVVDKAPKLIVRYRYRLQVPRRQKRESPDRVEMLDDSTYAALNAAVKPLTSATWSDVSTAPQRGEPNDSRKPLCPIPTGVSGDDREDYYGYGPGDSTIETLDDTSVWVRGQCYLARVTDMFGYYLPGQGLIAQISIKAPQGDDPERSFEVRGERVAIGTDASAGKVAADGAN